MFNMSRVPETKWLLLKMRGTRGGREECKLNWNYTKRKSHCQPWIELYIEKRKSFGGMDGKKVVWCLENYFNVFQCFLYHWMLDTLLLEIRTYCRNFLPSSTHLSLYSLLTPHMKHINIQITHYTVVMAWRNV